MIVTLEEMKQYLRVDFDDDDSLIETLITSATRLCMDITRQKRNAYTKYDLQLLYQSVQTGKLQLRHRQRWSHFSLRGGEEPQLVFFVQRQ